MDTMILAAILAVVGVAVILYAVKSGKKSNASTPKTVQQSIPFLQVYKDQGVIETEPGTFTRAYELDDINFAIAPEEEQESMFYNYEKFLNSFSEDTTVQIVIYNEKEERLDTFKKVLFESRSDKLNGYRTEMNRIIGEKIASAKNSLRQKKYLVVSVHGKDGSSVDQAMNRISTIDEVVNNAMRDVSPELDIKPQTIEERLRVLHSIYHQDGEGKFFENETHNEESRFSMRRLWQKDTSVKDWIAPTAMEFKQNYLKIGQAYAKVLYMENIPSELTTNFIKEVSGINTRMLVSVTYKPINQKKARNMLSESLINISAEIVAEQRRANQSGYTYDLLSPRLAESQTKAKDLLRDMAERDQRLFYACVTIVVFGDSLEEVNYNAMHVMSAADTHQVALRTLVFQQESGFNQSLPLALRKVAINRLLTTESGSIFIPFTSQELQQRNGLYYGINEVSGSFVSYHRYNGRNQNAIYLGQAGSGKSMAAKLEAVSALLKDPNNRVYIIDPEREYLELARRFNGTVINLAANGSNHLNPLDVVYDPSSDEDPISMKMDYIYGMFEIMLGANNMALSPRARNILHRVMTEEYNDYFDHLQKVREIGRDINIDRLEMPTLAKLEKRFAELAKTDSAARDIYDILSSYVAGNSIITQPTNIDTDNRFIVFDTMALGAGKKALGLYVCLNEIWNKMVSNYEEGRGKRADEKIKTWVYIDEFHLLLDSDNAAKFTAMLWKRARKWGCAPTAILQNTENLLRTEEARDVLNNTSFMMLFSMPKIDRENMRQLLQLPNSQLKYITDSKPGHGLMYTGNTVIPFNNEFPKDSSMYDMLSTSPLANTQRY